MKNADEIKKELKEVVPLLATLKSSPTIKVPTGYFTTLSANLIQQVRKEDVAAELKEMAPSLAQLEKKNVVEVPAYYFSAFPHQMMQQIALEEKAKLKVESPKWLAGLNNALENIAQVIFKPKYSLAFAGVASTVLIAAFLFTKVEQCNDLDCKLASLTDNEINNYLDNETDTYTDEIFEATDETTTSKTNSVQFENEMLRDVSDADLNNAILD